jgi:hypothetical protein
LKSSLHDSPYSLFDPTRELKPGSNLRLGSAVALAQRAGVATMDYLLSSMALLSCLRFRCREFREEELHKKKGPSVEGPSVCSGVGLARAWL